MREPLVITPETFAAPPVDVILFEGIVSRPGMSDRREALSPVLDTSDRLYRYQLLDGTLIAPEQVRPIPAAKK
jgi:hypothetical protein